MTTDLLGRTALRREELLEHRRLEAQKTLSIALENEPSLLGIPYTACKIPIFVSAFSLRLATYPLACASCFIVRCNTNRYMGW